MNDREYEQRSLTEAYNHMQQIEKAPLSDRKEAAKEFVETKSKKGCTFDREKAGVGKLTKKLAAELTDSPAVFPLPTNAMHLAHMIGRYVMSLGDIVDGYTSYDGPDKDEFWARAFD